MPRKDRTFSKTDILRIITRNLEIEERRSVIIALCKDIAIDEIAGELKIVPLEDFRRGLEETGLIETAIDAVMLLLRKF